MLRSARFVRALPLLASLLVLLPGTAQAQTIVWTRQFGTTGTDVAQDAVADASGVFVVGTTNGSLGGNPQLGGGDAFIRRYSGGGAVRWTRTWGGPEFDGATSVALQGSELFVGGQTGALGDAFVAAYDLEGNLLWSDIFGESTGQDYVQGVAADATGVVVAADVSHRLAGLTHHGADDVVLRRYDLNGTVLWTKEIGTKGNDVDGKVALDGAGSLYVSFTTNGAVPGAANAGFNDIVLRRYDLDGHAIWTRQFGTAEDEQSFSAVADPHGVYVAGLTRGVLAGTSNAGLQDEFVRKYRPGGVAAWTSQIGSPGDDVAFDLSLSGPHLFVGGFTEEALPGQTNSGGIDAFVIEQALNGTTQSVTQLGTAGYDIGEGVAVSNGRAFLVGYTNGTFPGQVDHGGTYDAFVTKIA